MSDEPLKVDMLAAARDAQWTSETFLGAGASRVIAPAKVNLFLAVGGVRLDGYHEVDTVMHALSLHDTLHMHRVPLTADEAAHAVAEGADVPHQAVGGPASNLVVSIDVADKANAPYPQAIHLSVGQNLVFKALDGLARAIGHEASEAISLRIEKAIPFEAGLAGGSSDAAAALLMAARWWGLAPDDPVLASVACNLGADVAFFLQGGCALFEGKGSTLVRRLEPKKDALVLVKPPAGVATAQAYAAFDEQPAPIPIDLLAQAQAAGRAADVPLFNNLAAASGRLAPDLAEVAAWLAQQPGVAGAQDVLLCGSGATTFARTASFADACTIAAAAQQRGWWARATTFSGLRAAVV